MCYHFAPIWNRKAQEVAALAEHIRAVRGSRSEEEFAGALGCSLNTLRRWENGGTPRSAAHIRLLEREGVPRPVIDAHLAARTASVAA